MPTQTDFPSSGTPTPSNPSGTTVPAGTTVPVKRQERLGLYRAEVGASQRHMEGHNYRRINYHDNWRRFIEMYSEHRESTDPNVDEIDVPIGFANINILRSSLTVNNPKFTTQARNRESFLSAVVCEQVMNYEWYHQDLQDEIRSATDDMLIMGNGWLKVSYKLTPAVKRSAVPQLASSKFEEGESAYARFEEVGYNVDFDLAAETAQSAVQRPAMGRGLPAMGRGMPSRAQMARQLREQGAIYVEDEMILERVSPFDMYVDPSGTSMKNIQWIAQRSKVRSDVAADKKEWKASVRKELVPGQKSLAEAPEGEATHTRGHSISERPSDDGGIEWVVVWELYDLHTGEFCVFADSGDDFLVDPKPMPLSFGHPFIYTGNYSVPDKFWHLGELERIETLQIELNKTRTALVNDRKANRRRALVDKKYLEQDHDSSLMTVLQSSEDGAIAAIDLHNRDKLSEIIHMVQPPNLDPNLYNVGAQMENDINEVTGITEYQRGGRSPGASTATEAAIINDGALARMREKQGKVERLMRDAARRLLQLKLQYMKSRKAIRITEGASAARGNPLGRSGLAEATEAELGAVGLTGVAGELFYNYSVEDIRGEYDLWVEAGSSTAYSESERRRAAQELMAALAPFMQLGIVNVPALLEHVLRSSGIPNAQSFLLQPEPIPPQPAQAQGGAQGIPLGSGGPAVGGPAVGVSSVAGGVGAPNGGVPESQTAPGPSLVG